jgi:hypothetical protein
MTLTGTGKVLRTRLLEYSRVKCNADVEVFSACHQVVALEVVRERVRGFPSGVDPSGIYVACSLVRRTFHVAWLILIICIGRTRDVVVGRWRSGLSGLAPGSRLCHPVEKGAWQTCWWQRWWLRGYYCCSGCGWNVEPWEWLLRCWSGCGNDG